MSDKYPIQVCFDGKNYFLRLHFQAYNLGVMRFESEHAYSKREADARAVGLSVEHGFDREELPTHALVEPYPS